MALVSYNNINNHLDPITVTLIDSGTYSAPTDRNSTFTPSAGYVAPSSIGQANFGAAGNDWSVGTVPAQRPQVFEPPSFTCTLDPGMAVNG